MSILHLCLTFFKIGCVAWGGGYAMIPLLERELIGPGWLSPQEFLDIVAVSEMTPGPIAVISATFVGHRLYGLLGGALTTLSVITPSIVLVFLLAHFLARYRNHPLVGRAMSGIHVAIVVLITCAGLYILPVVVVDYKRVILAVVAFFLITKTQLNSVLIILLGGVVGMIFAL